MRLQSRRLSTPRQYREIGAGRKRNADRTLDPFRRPGHPLSSFSMKEIQKVEFAHARRSSCSFKDDEAIPILTFCQDGVTPFFWTHHSRAVPARRGSFFRGPRCKQHNKRRPMGRRIDLHSMARERMWSPTWDTKSRLVLMRRPSQWLAWKKGRNNRLAGKRFPANNSIVFSLRSRECKRPHVSLPLELRLWFPHHELLRCIGAVH